MDIYLNLKLQVRLKESRGLVGGFHELGPQIRSGYTMILLIWTHRKGTPIFGNAHIDAVGDSGFGA